MDYEKHAQALAAALEAAITKTRHCPHGCVGDACPNGRARAAWTGPALEALRDLRAAECNRMVEATFGGDPRPHGIDATPTEDE